MQSKRTSLPPPPPITDYEKQRMVRIQHNNQVLYQLLPSLSAKENNNGPKGNGNDVAQDVSADYDPGQDAGHDANSDDDASVTPPKVCRS